MSNILLQGPLSALQLANCLAEFESDPHVGANSSFVGRVRADVVEGKVVKGIEYSAYESMAAKVAAEIEGECREKFGADRMRIWHAVGFVGVGEASLLLVVASAHRKASFRALEYAVDELKKRFPAWKKECFEDGTHRWIGEPGSG